MERQGIFDRLLMSLAVDPGEAKTVIFDATSLKAHCMASSLGAKKGRVSDLIGRTKGGMNTEPPAAR